MNRQKHSLPRRVLAILLMAAMLITMLPSAMLATETTTDGTGHQLDVSKSKTAENLQQTESGDWQSEITLSLPAADYSEKMDVVFALDDTSAGSQIFSESVMDLLNELAATKNLDINVGIVAFDAVARDWLSATSNGTYEGLVSIKDQEKLQAIEKAVKTQLSYDSEGYTKKVGATNTEWPIDMATEMLNGGEDDAEKYMIVFSDMYGYVYRGDLTVDGILYHDVPLSIRHQGYNNGQLAISAPKYETWNELYNNDDPEKTSTEYDSFFRDSSWDDYWNIFQNISPELESATNSPAWGERYLTPFEKSTCLTYDRIQEALDDGIQVTVVNNDFGTDYPSIQTIKNGMLDALKDEGVNVIRETAAHGEDFSSEQTSEIFAGLKDELVQVVDSGSYVVDEIGDDFDFVNDVDDITLTVDGEPQQPAEMSGTNATAAWSFGNGAYTLEYYKGGTTINGESYGECFVWTTNVAITKDGQVQLTYKVQLNNPSTEPGEYGTYDADGSKGYDGLYTNNSATIYPVDSNGEAGTPEAFAEPTVSYTVEPQDVVLDGDTYLNITKKFMGSSWPSNEKFQFEIKAADNFAANTPLPEDTRITIAAPSNGSENSGAFGNITYTEPGTYIYTITEVEGNHDNIIYDDHVLTITVTVDKDMNIAVDTDGSRTFTNIRWNDETTPGTTDEETPDLNTQDHYSYIVGYPEDYRTGEATDNEDLWPVKPQGNITRAEVATIFYRLLTDEARAENWTQSNDFTDVSSDDWFNTPVSTLSAMGILTGYEDGSFQPNAPITRAEFAAIAVRFYENDSVDYINGTFSDITGSEWFADAVQAAKEQGIIGGYPDGSFQPNKAITRAEACSIVNRTLDRAPHEDYLLPDTIMRTWPDNQKGAWYYADIQEATNGHEYEWVTSDGTNHENWTGDRDEIDWDEVERELEALHGVN